MGFWGQYIRLKGEDNTASVTVETIFWLFRKLPESFLPTVFSGVFDEAISGRSTLEDHWSRRGLFLSISGMKNREPWRHDRGIFSQMVNCLFGIRGRWFGVLEFCYERDCYFSGYPPGNYRNISPSSQHFWVDWCSFSRAEICDRFLFGLQYRSTVLQTGGHDPLAGELFWWPWLGFAGDGLPPEDHPMTWQLW